MQSMGLKPWEDDDANTGKRIAASFATADEEDKSTPQGGSSGNGSASKAK